MYHRSLCVNWQQEGKCLNNVCDFLHKVYPFSKIMIGLRVVHNRTNLRGLLMCVLSPQSSLINRISRHRIVLDDLTIWESGKYLKVNLTVPGKIINKWYSALQTLLNERRANLISQQVISYLTYILKLALRAFCRF